jgi:predicted CXXCH cytochrome family protein
MTWDPELVKDAIANCMACHATGYNVNTERWSEFGVTCEACHGPGSLHVVSGDKSKIFNLKNLPFDRQSMVCGQCHSSGKDLTGGHPFPTEFHPGDDLNKVFIIDNSRQGSEYSDLINSKHLKNDVICTVCHNPHGPVEGTLHQLRKPVNELCMECHNDKTLSEHAPDAAAGTTCATCHMPGGSHQFTIPHHK